MLGMLYTVRFVEDDALPSDVEFVFAVVDDKTMLFMKASTINPETGECEALSRPFATWEAAMGRVPVPA